jgi:phosphomannomutase
MLTKELRDAAEAWIAADPDPETRDELARLAAAGETVELADRLNGTLAFGTAGLRGVLGAGPNRMNRAVVRRASYGVGRALCEEDGAAGRGVVIGYDGRRLSRELAAEAAEVFAGLGVVVHLFDALGPTPLTAFAVLHLGAAAGVMVTASHNPPEYNGYKVYWGNGAQIIPPTDARIAAHIAAAPPAIDVPRLPLDEARRRGLARAVDPSVERAYLDGVAALGRPGGERGLRIVYTPLHGVGGRLVAAVLAEAGFHHLHSVPAQAEPDGAFPTVTFPNPEEKGAMDLAYALGREVGAQLVLANDPDADRLAVAIPDAGAPGGYLQLTGNQVGVLLGDYLLERDPGGAERLVVNSLVSSPMLGAIARALGVRHEETLTGFKWIANRAMALEAAEGLRFVFGYEEALGYAVGPLVRDKDGVSAVLLAAELAARLAAKGQTLLDRLEALYRRHGLFLSTQVNVTRRGPGAKAELAALLARLRARPVEAIGAYRVGRTRDLAEADILIFDLEGQSRIIVRPSGTEPKVKFYVDLCTAFLPGESFAAARARAEAEMQALADEVVRLAGA